MTNTTHLGLPYIEAAQAQKHVTHNEALAILDALVMLAVADRDLSAPPVSPAEGDRYLVKAPGAGGFAGKDDQIAHYADGGWSFYAPRAGWVCYVRDESALIAWDGAAWGPALDVLAGGSALQNLSLLGLGATADATNPFSAKINNALWTAKAVAEGGDGDLRLKLNKESAAKTLSLLFQDNYSARAEIGLAGDDDFRVKVSPDGSSWIDALSIDRSTGRLTGSLSAMAGCGRLGYVSATQIKFAPLNGDSVKIAGLWRAIPASGVSAGNTGVYVGGVAGQNLAANTTYYVYLFDDSGALAIDFSTTAHATDASAGNVGVEIKSGDNSRSLIGMVRTTSAAQFADGPTQRLVLSWFNRRTRQGINNVNGATTASDSSVELNSAKRVEFLCWSDEDTSHFMGGYGSNSSAGCGYAFQLDIDGSALAAEPSIMDNGVAGGRTPFSFAVTHTAGEGYHYDSFYGRRTGGGGTVTASAAHFGVSIRG
jgi:hypothetical protein